MKISLNNECEMQNCYSMLHNRFKLSIGAAALIILMWGPGCSVELPGSSKSSIQQTRGNVVNSQENSRESSCGLLLSVTGSQFSPQLCTFQIITPGESCGPNVACAPQYGLFMKAGIRPHILEVNLLNIKEFKEGTYRFLPDQNARDFNGYALDGNASVRNLLSGEIVLERSARERELSDRSSSVKVSFDVTFAGGIQMRGTGEVPVQRISAP